LVKQRYPLRATAETNLIEVTEIRVDLFSILKFLFKVKMEFQGLEKKCGRWEENFSLPIITKRLGLGAIFSIIRKNYHTGLNLSI
jgi:hypothetical protein